MKNSELHKVENLLGYVFSDKSLLVRALTRKAYALEQRQQGFTCKDQEYYRILGDSVLKFSLVELLEQNGYTTRDAITSKKKTLEDRQTLGTMELAKQIAPFIRFGKGEASQKIDQQVSVRAETFEAIIAAIYQDSNLSVVRSRVNGWFSPLF